MVAGTEAYNYLHTTNSKMHANITVLDPIGDLIIIIEGPKDQELVADIVLAPPKRKEKKPNAAERRRMRRRELLGNQKPDVIPAHGTIVHLEDLAPEGEGGTSSPRLGEIVNNLEEPALACDEDQANFATENVTQPSYAVGSNEQHSCPLQPEDSGEQNVARFRISSSHLRLASAQFRRFLSSSYHGTVKDQFSLEDGTTCDVLRTEQWDPKAFLILLHIVHGHNRQVPHYVSIDFLGKLAVLVDYYECHERVELFARRWIEALRGDLPDTYGETAILWLAISWVFMEKGIFKQMTELVLKHSKCAFEADTLPLPPMLFAKLEIERQRATKRLHESVHHLQRDLEEGKRGCSDACCCMLLGSIIKERRKHNVGESRSLTPFHGRSLHALKQVVMKFQSPSWFSQPSSYSYSPHKCTLVELLQPDIDEIWASLDGLELEDYVPVFEHSTAIPM